MSNLQQSDLILAGRYVDGDLPAQEVAAVESRIGSDSEFSAVVDRIRHQSTALNLLPQFKPSDDLADRTLQASMDQVRAIMGAWPIEDADSKPIPKSELPLNNSDWKSTIALIASLAGVVMLGMILWQNNNGSDSGNSGTAMQQPFKTDSGLDDREFESASPKGKESVDPAKENLADMQAKSVNAPTAQKPDLPESENRRQVADRSQAGSNRKGSGGGNSGAGIMGTPAKLTTPNVAVFNNQPANVAQIWCVNPDQSVPKNAVCEILQSNKIDVRLEEKNQLTSNAFDAYYVAATPSQMKQVLTEISNEANIEMFPLPQRPDSLIADAIQQQFQQSRGSTEEQIASQQPLDANVPEKLVLPTSNALAQQLKPNWVPKAQPPLDPPPIVQSESLNENLEIVTPTVAMKRLKVAGTPGKGNTVPSQTIAPPATNSIAQQAFPAPQGSVAKSTAIPESHGTIDKLLDDSNQTLQQYLILVHADEQKSP